MAYSLSGSSKKPGLLYHGICQALQLPVQEKSAQCDGNACWKGSLHFTCRDTWRSIYKTYFSSLKPVLGFQSLMLATLGKWATNHERVFFFLWQELLLDFAAWINLTSNADTLEIDYIQLHLKFQTTLRFFKTC